MNMQSRPRGGRRPRSLVMGSRCPHRYARTVGTAMVLALAAGLVAPVAAADGDDDFTVWCLPEAEAREEAARLEAEGMTVTRIPVRCRAGLSEIRILGFASQAAAERVARQFHTGDAPATYFSDSDDAYGVVIGPFGSESRLQRHLRRIQRTGHRNLEIGPPPRPVPAFHLRATIDADAQPEAFVFGTPADDTPRTRARQDEEPRARFGLDRGRMEGGATTSSDAASSTSSHAMVAVSGRYDPNPFWEFRAGARLDGVGQTGDANLGSARVDYEDTFVRYSSPIAQLTIGAQTPAWGKMDELPPTDRLATRDLTRFNLDPLEDRYRASPAVRFETTLANHRVDAVFLPVFRPATLPHDRSIWHPIDQREGRLLGRREDAALGVLVREGSFDDDVSGDGGGGIRLSRAGRGLDYAVTIQRTRHSTPYYALDEDARQALLETGDPAAALAAADEDTFRARHPRTFVVGGDLAFAAGGITWRAEAAWLSDVPVTTNDLAFDTVEAIDWAASMEGFPGDRDLRVTLQVSAQHLLDAGDIEDDAGTYYVGGEIENSLDRGRWRVRLRFSNRLDRRDVYANPEIAYTGIPAQELYLGAHYYEGTDGTAGGYFRDNRLLVAGWRGQF